MSSSLPGGCQQACCLWSKEASETDHLISRCVVLCCVSCRVHFVFVVLFTAYGMWLLDQHYKVKLPGQ